ncbi:MAG: carbon-nitrogen hydrolase family protein [Candidatus Nanopelagicales bacterium]
MTMQQHSRYVDLVAVQPRVRMEEYASERAYADHHRALADRAADLVAQAGPDPDGATPAVLAVWPEMVGTFLVLQGRADAVRGATTTDQALTRVALRMLPRLLATMASHRTLSTTRAFLTAAAPEAWGAHHRTFAAIARDRGWWVVAGSLLVPRNALGEASAQFRALGGPEGAKVYNTAFTFDPSGRCVLSTRKVNLVPTQEDVLDLSPGDPADLVVLDTEVGRLGTLICYDGFREPHTSGEPEWEACVPRLDRLGATVLAQPSANAWLWDAPWAFNDESIGERQLRKEQWFTEGLFSSMAALTSIRYAVNPQLVGDVLDNHFEAPSLILGRSASGEAEVLAQSDDPYGEDVLHARVPLAAD